MIIIEYMDKEGNKVTKKEIISPSQTKVNNPYFRANIVGSFLPSVPPPPLRNKILLVPS